MIESRLAPADDGTGGGYGNYPGLTVAQIADRFRHLAEEGGSRSARAVLRLVHEQVAARGTLGVQRLLVVLGAAIMAVLAAAYALGPESLRPKLRLYLAAAALVTGLFSVGALSVRRAAARNAAQVREIRRLALLALERIVDAPGFAPKPLEREHLRALDEARRVDRERGDKVVRSLGL